ncbi:hypothetical protein ACT3TD_06775 [Corynebacterium sp. AOP36-E1-14]|uniref:hypothetical protein n=1 Tax=unclassified Corynebacterium TaxID=2624378 RepID=UPI003F939A1B
MRALSAATLVVAVSGYAVIVVAGRALDTVGYEVFAVFWGLFFALAGLIDGLLQETTRSVAARTTAAGRTGQAPRAAAASSVRPMAVAAGLAVVVATVVAASGPLWAGRILPDGSGLAGAGVVLMAVGLASYTFQAAVCGLLSAAMRWTTFAWLISVDSAVRIVLALIAWAAGWQLLAFLLVTVVGAATWLGLLLVSPSSRRLLHEVGDVGTAEFLRRTCKAMLASGANAVLITGFPVLITFTSGADVSPGALAAVITAVTLTRAPLLVPLQRFQPALIVHLTAHRDRVLRACVLPATVIVATAAVGGVAAYGLARPLMLLFFDEELVSSPVVLAALTVASASTALLMVTGSAAHAAERHSLYLAGWAVATVAAVALLSVDASPEVRAVLTLGLAPLTGVVVHVVALTLSRPARECSSARTR